MPASQPNATADITIYTDGGASPNPGAGAWAFIYIANDQVLHEHGGYCPKTTNNRMELQALIEAYRQAPNDLAITVYSDSQLCVRTVCEWAPTWKRNGWRRKTGPISNLDLVQELYSLAQAKPKLSLRWIRAHSGHRWNEYVDTLVQRYRRKGQTHNHEA
jgi:ribonuclease HI